MADVHAVARTQMVEYMDRLVQTEVFELRDVPGRALEALPRLDDWLPAAAGGAPGRLRSKMFLFNAPHTGGIRKALVRSAYTRTLHTLNELLAARAPNQPPLEVTVAQLDGAGSSTFVYYLFCACFQGFIPQGGLFSSLAEGGTWFVRKKFLAFLPNDENARPELIVARQAHATTIPSTCGAVHFFDLGEESTRFVFPDERFEHVGARVSCGSYEQLIDHNVLADSICIVMPLWTPDELKLACFWCHSRVLRQKPHLLEDRILDYGYAMTHWFDDQAPGLRAEVDKRIPNVADTLESFIVHFQNLLLTRVPLLPDDHTSLVSLSSSPRSNASGSSNGEPVAAAKLTPVHGTRLIGQWVWRSLTARKLGLDILTHIGANETDLFLLLSQPLLMDAPRDVEDSPLVGSADAIDPIQVGSETPSPASPEPSPSTSPEHPPRSARDATPSSGGTSPESASSDAIPVDDAPMVDLREVVSCSPEDFDAVSVTDESDSFDNGGPTDATEPEESTHECLQVIVESETSKSFSPEKAASVVAASVLNSTPRRSSSRKPSSSRQLVRGKRGFDTALSPVVDLFGMWAASPVPRSKRQREELVLEQDIQMLQDQMARAARQWRMCEAALGTMTSRLHVLRSRKQ